jgi:hypothetical protein
MCKKALDHGDPSPGMTAERAARLEALGLAWSKGWLLYRHQRAAWEAQVARLAAYKTAHGDCNVPRGWAEDPRLAGWVNSQRARKRQLDRGEPGQGMTAERVARLTALGFVWGSTKIEMWEAQVARLVAYKAAHGDCNVPWGWAEDPRLASWVNSQRARKRKLDRGKPSHGMTVEWAARLEALGFVWEGPNASISHPDDAKWEAQLARLAAYKAAHGDCNVPRGWAEDPRLSSWVNSQRARKRQLDRLRSKPSQGLTAERAAKLEALGFVYWKVDEQQQDEEQDEEEEEEGDEEEDSESSGGGEDYAVEAILDGRGEADARSYLIKWRPRTRPWTRTWEPVSAAMHPYIHAAPPPGWLALFQRCGPARVVATRCAHLPNQRRENYM